MNKLTLRRIHKDQIETFQEVRRGVAVRAAGNDMVERQVAGANASRADSSHVADIYSMSNTLYMS